MSPLKAFKKEFRILTEERPLLPNGLWAAPLKKNAWGVPMI